MFALLILPGRHTPSYQPSYVLRPLLGQARQLGGCTLVDINQLLLQQHVLVVLVDIDPAKGVHVCVHYIWRRCGCVE